MLVVFGILGLIFIASLTIKHSNQSLSEISNI